MSTEVQYENNKIDVHKVSLPSSSHDNIIDGDNSSTSSGTSSSPEVDQHLHEQEKKSKTASQEISNSREMRKSLRSSETGGDKASSGDDGNRAICGTDGPRHSYDRSRLLEIRENVGACNSYPNQLLPSNDVPLPLEKKWLEDILKTSLKSSSETEGGASAVKTQQQSSETKKAGTSKDPRDRVKQEEQDGIVLSPQRRSFGTGCHVLNNYTSGGSGLRPSSPADRVPRGPGDPPSLTSVVHHRGEPQSHRRIGSGRIMRRDDLELPGTLLESRGRGPRASAVGSAPMTDHHEDNLRTPRDARDWRNKESPHLSGHQYQRYDREERFDRRRGFFEDLDLDKSNVPNMRRHQQNNHQQQQGGGDMRPHHHKGRHQTYQHRGRQEEEETPEWFSEGPTSQNEFIELVGFDGPAVPDDPPPNKAKKDSPVSALKRESSRPASASGSKSPASLGGEGDPRSTPPTTKVNSPKSSSDPQSASPPIKGEQKLPHLNVEEVQSGDPVGTGGPLGAPSGGAESMVFDVEDFLENIIGADGTDLADSGGHPQQQSKLKQFFKSRQSPVLGRPNTPSQGEGSVAAQVTGMLGEGNLDCVSGFGGGLPAPGSRTGAPPTSGGIDSSHYFSPINPADPCGPSSGPSIVDLLQQANLNLPQEASVGVRGHGGMVNQPPSVKDLLMGGKGQCVEDLEAGMIRKMALGGGGHQQPPVPPVSSSANTLQFTDFNEFLNQVTSSGSPPPSRSGGGPPSSFGPPDNSAARAAVRGMHLPPSDDILSKFLSGSKEVKPPGLGMQHPNGPTDADIMSMLMNCKSGPPTSAANYPRGVSSPGPQTLHVPPPIRPQQHGQQQQQHLSNQEIMKYIHQQKLQQQQQHQFKRQHAALQAMQLQQQQDPIKQLVGNMQQQRAVSPHHNMGINGTQNPFPPPPAGGVGAQGPPPVHPPHPSHGLRPDVQNLLQRVYAGQISDVQLLAQLQNSSLPPLQRENINTVLQLLAPPNNMLSAPRNQLTPSPTHKGGLCLGSGPVSPRVLSPNPVDCNMLSPHPMTQTRLSPLMFGGGGPPPPPNAGGAGGAPRPLPSHQELVARAQCILQKALLKQELEKSKEKHRKRDSERGRSPNPMMGGPPPANPGVPTSCHHKEGSPHKSMTVKSQSPLAFTPTSVMRKMTADKSGNPDGKGSDNCPRIDAADSMGPHPGSSSVGYPQASLMQSTSHGGQQLLGPKGQQLVMSSAGNNPLRGAPPSGNPAAFHSGTGPNIPPYSSFRMQPPPSQNLNYRHHNISQLQAQAAAAAFAQQHQFSRGGPQAPPSNARHPMPPHHPHHLYNNINNNSGQPPFSKAGAPDAGSTPINLAALLGSDSLAHVRNMPEVPGHNAFSLEEIESMKH